MKILLTGATGLLGGALLDSFSSEGYDVRCLVRPHSPNASRLDPDAVEVAYGDATDSNALHRALAGMDALLHVAGVEYAPSVVEAARRSGVGRLVIVSSTSAHSAFPFRSGPKLGMERVVRGSGLDWTIVRPSMIYGSERDKNVHRLLRFLDRSPVAPIFGSGANLWQPVYHKDCAHGIHQALVRSEALHETYDLPGAKPLTYRTLVETAAHALGRQPLIAPIPLSPVYRTLLLTEKLHIPLPVASEQVLRLREDKAYSYEKARRELGYAPRTFAEGVALEVERLRGIGLVRS